MKPVVIPHKKVAGYLGLTDDKLLLIRAQDPTFPKPIRLGGAGGHISYNVNQLDEWKAGQLGLKDVCTSLSDLLYTHGIDITEPLQATSGVYLLYKAGTLVYVGQSVNVFSRIPQHRRKEFDRALFIPCKVEVLDVVESALIAALHPKENGPPPLREMRLVELPALVEQYKGAA